MIFSVLTPDGQLGFASNEGTNAVQTYAFEGGVVQLRYGLDGSMDSRRFVDDAWTEWNPLATAAGGTASRPSEPAVGACFFDTTLSQPVWWNGTGWVDAMGDPV